MKEHLRFAVAYWHSFVGNGADPFGEPTHVFEWNKKSDPVERAKDKMDAAFEFMTKMNLPYYCFHDVDVVDYGNDINENDRRLQALVDYAKQKQAESGVKLLWGTANLFSQTAGI
jgi:xylose isomerase